MRLVSLRRLLVNAAQKITRLSLPFTCQCYSRLGELESKPKSKIVKVKMISVGVITTLETIPSAVASPYRKGRIFFSLVRGSSTRQKVKLFRYGRLRSRFSAASEHSM